MLGTTLVDGEQNADGSTSSGFSIPAGQVLVVTQVRFFAGAGASDFVLWRETASNANAIISTRVALDAGGRTDTKVR